jgi:hypothetical protein
MAITFVVNYAVKDFAIWKEGFDSRSDIREAVGIKATAFKNMDDPNLVFVIGEAPSKTVLKAIFGDPNFIELMKKLGVITEPNITFLETS